MKKPVHWFTFIIWIGAVLYSVSEIFRLTTVGAPNVLAYWLAGRAVVIVTIQLAALAIIVEIADQIRWRGLTPEEQYRLLEPSALDRRLTG